MKALVGFFGGHCEDSETLLRLEQMIDDRGAWPRARHLFDAIRAKTLKAEKQNDQSALVQYVFEEVCAKTLYNLTHGSAPYDADSPYWIVPNALKLAESLGMDPQEVIKRVI